MLLPPKNPATRPAVANLSPNQDEWLIQTLIQHRQSQKSQRSIDILLYLCMTTSSKERKKEYCVIL